MKHLKLGAFENGNYRLFFYGYLISVVGTSMQIIMEAWLVYRLTQSTLWLGVVHFCAQGAAFVASPVAGVMIDRSDRRKLLIGIQIAAMMQSALLTALFFMGVIQTWQIVILTTVLGVITAFEISTRHAFAADLVGRDRLSSAIGLNAVALNIGRALGPSLAGAFVAAAGEGREGWGFAFNTVSFLAVIVGLWRVDSASLFVTTRPAQAARRSFFDELSIGLKHAARTPRIRQILIFMTILSLFAGPYLVLFPSLAEKNLGGGGKTLGLISAATGCGALFGVIGAAKIRPVLRDIWLKLTFDAVLLGTSFIVLGISTNLYLSMTAAFFVGFCLLAAFPLTNVSIQNGLEDHMRGRIISLLPMTFLGTAPIGGLLLGFLTDRTSVSVATGVVGIVCIALGVTYRLTVAETHR